MPLGLAAIGIAMLARDGASGLGSEAIQAPVAPRQDGGVFEKVCATCHGLKGEGKSEMKSPSIASLPRWYVKAQLERFRGGVRGADPRDATGQIMRAAVLALDEKEIEEAIEHVDKLKPIVSQRTLEGDPEKGAFAYEIYCMECHRFNGQGEVVFGSAPIAGLQDWYLLAQYEKFSEGIRGGDPDEEVAAKMHHATKLVEDRSQIPDIIARVMTLAEKYPIKK